MNEILEKLKKLRDNNVALDFFAGFIPGVGEAQDIHDFVYSAQNKDYGGMALASLGLFMPFVNGSQIKKGVKLVDEIADSRKFAKATDAPIYTKETYPKKLKLNEQDITEMHLNDGSPKSEKIKDSEVFREMSKRFNEADHGIAIRIGESLEDAEHGLSSASAPLYYKMSRRWEQQGKGGYFIPEGEPALVPLNKVAQDEIIAGDKVHPPFSQATVDKINKEIKTINELGYDFPLARLEEFSNPFKLNTPQYEMFEKANKKKGKLLVPNIGFLKFKNGGIYRKTT